MAFLADLIAAFSAGFLAGSTESSDDPSHVRMAVKISFRRASCALEPATSEATFCSSITFQLMNASTSG